MKYPPSVFPRMVLWASVLVCVLIAGYAVKEYYYPQKDTVVVFDFSSCKKAGNPIMESYPEQCKGANGITYVNDVVPAKQEEVTLPLIVVSSPPPTGYITSPTTIKGYARGYWFFEASAPAKIVDDTGKVLAEGPIQTIGDWMTESYVPFEGTLTWSATPTTPTGKILLKNDNPSGIPDNDRNIVVPIRFTEVVGQKMVNVLFANETMGSGQDCQLVFPVVRTISSTTSIAQATARELLLGPTADEQSQGYSSLIPSNTKIQSMILKDGVLAVDFSKELTEGVAGSCMVGTIRAQIEETLRQWSTVEKVIISVNGDSETILQP